MNRMRAGQAALIARQQAVNGVEVTYTRGTDVVPLTAWAGNTVYRRNVMEAAAVLFGERDYLIAVADLAIDGTAITPKKGDRIAEVIDEVTVTFEVMPAADGEPVWRFSDKTRMLFRVHCKRVAT